MAKPAGKRRFAAVDMTGGDIDEGGRTRPTVEVFIGATHREIRAAARHIDGQRACGMRQIPDRDGTGIMRLLRERGHVMHPPGAVIDLRQHQHGKIAVDMVRDILWGDHAQFIAAVQ